MLKKTICDAEALIELFPAHTVLGRAPDPEQSACDYLFVQGRNDRLHAFRVVELPLDTPSVTSFALVPANWHWLVLSEADYGEAQRAVVALADTHSLGVLTVDGGGRLVRAKRAPAKPGIFGRQHPQLYSAWRELSDW